jgi:DNA-binding XRE family transcriptional regulator
MLFIYNYLRYISHPEHSLPRFLRQTESKDLRLLLRITPRISGTRCWPQKIAAKASVPRSSLIDRQPGQLPHQLRRLDGNRHPWPVESVSLPPLKKMIPKVRGPIVIYGDFIMLMSKEQEAQIQTQFGQRVRELRKLKNLSQEALALACDLDRTYIGGVERGERNISLLNIHKLAKALGVPAKDLLDA